MNINDKKRERKLYSMANALLGDPAEKSKASTQKAIGLGQSAASQTESSMSRMLADTGNKKDKSPMLERDKFDAAKAEQDIAAWIASIRGLSSEDDTMVGAPRQESEGPIRPMARAKNAASTDLSERELLAKTIQAEAGGESYEGKLAVGAVIANRVSKEGYGDSFYEVILAPGQFSAWNSVTGYAGGKGGLNMDTIRPSKESYEIADKILSGEYESPVADATHYYNPSVVEPKWGQKYGGDWTEIGGHVFGYANKG